MKKTLLLLSLLLSASAHSGAENRLTVEEFAIKAGETEKAVNIILENDESFTAVEFVLWLPDGVTIMSEGDNYFVLGNDDRLKQKSGWTTYTHSVNVNRQENGSYKFLIYSGDSKDIVGDSGTQLLTMGLMASDEVSTGEQTVRIENLKLARSNATAVYPADASFNCTVSIDVPVSAAGYATFSWPRALDFAESGVEAYIAKGDFMTTGKVSLVQVTKVPANTGVVLKGSEGTYHPQTTDAAATDDVSGNQLVSTASGEVAVSSDGFLALGNKGGTVGFYMVNSSTGLKIPQYRAYLQGGANGSRQFVAFRDEVTAVSGVTASTAAAGLYTLSGQRVVKTRRGLYVSSGKKIVVK